MRHDREALGLRLGEGRVGRDQRDRRVLARAALERGSRARPAAARAAGRGRRTRRCARRRRPEMRAGADRHVPTALTTTSAPTVAPSRVTPRPSRGRPSGRRWWRRAGAGAAEREVAAALRGRRVAEIAIGRKAAPVLVAAVQEIEQDRARHDRHARRCRSRSRGPARAARPARRPAHRARTPSRRRARSRRCARPSCPARAGRFRACPARRRARRSEATAGSSNTIAVTPEASRASSALPTLRPATSVMRLRMFTSDHIPECGRHGRRGLQERAHVALRPLEAAWPPTSPFPPRCSPGC